ncbi:conserved hypothetical protein [Paenibacillus curdlanolyticus YK9]|uniref:YviE n=1 Tax=Paenibacillus curdlanolyticus YK9 TaxID=717606 RepID=E0IED1_9BACL|nr:DUF6470 family protein [Paenibacillus curdlanolyticus]EFM09019.1 conserved hypothetical protein [Paenibacillus curdlanolyticus YK9]
MNNLRLSIHQTFASIGIDAEPATQEMRLPRGEQLIEQPAAKMNFESTNSQLSIDSSQAWHALGKGPNLEWSSAIYSQMKSVFLQNLARQVEEGKRMSNITNPRSAFADLAQDALFRDNLVDYQVAEPSYNNVKLEFAPGDVSTDIEASPVVIEYTPHKAEIEAYRGKLDIYLRQRNSISIEVSTYDLYK